MKVAVFGAGYVGLVTGACFAELGHDVVVRDVVEAKVDALRAGVVPIYEPGLDELLARNRERLTFTTDVARGRRRRRRRLHRRRHAADLLGRRRPLRRLDGGRRAPAGRPSHRGRDEEHGAGRHRASGAAPPRRSRPRERRLRLEPGVHRRGNGGAGLHASRPDRDRRVRRRRRRRGRRAPRRDRRARSCARDVASAEMVKLAVERGAHDARELHQRDRERLRGDRSRRRRRRRGRRPRPSHRPALPARGDRLRRLAASRRTRSRSSSSLRTRATTSSS